MTISTKVREAGVVGAGGAGFPTHVKLAAQAEIVIVNGAECEPLLKTDQQLAPRYPEKLIKGLSLAMEATGAKQGNHLPWKIHRHSERRCLFN